MTSDAGNSCTDPSTPRSPRGLKILVLGALAIFVVAAGGVFLFDATTDPGFRTSAMESRVRAGLPPGWKMTVTEADAYSGPCIDGCDGSALQVELTPPEPRSNRAGQQHELADAMRTGGWRYSAPSTRKQALAAYARDYPTELAENPFPDDETIGFDPSNAGWFEGGPTTTGSRVTYDMNAQWLDGQLFLELSAVAGD